MSNLTLAHMKSTLMSFDEAYALLEKTEPFQTLEIDATTKTSFKFDGGWEQGVVSAGMIDPVPVFITINGSEFQFSKEGLYQAVGLIGLSTNYMMKTPVQFILPQLEYWFNSGIGDSVYKLVIVKGVASAWIKPTIVPFSNIAILESLHAGIQDLKGRDVDVLVDFKNHNSLQRTDLRLIVPSILTEIKNTNMADVPSDSKDVWSAGVNIHNSMIGKSQTSLDSYLFRWWGTSGAIERHPEVGIWNRRSSGQSEESVYEWAYQSAETLLTSATDSFKRIQALPHIKPRGNTADVLKDIFTDYKVPIATREPIEGHVIAANEITMYSIMSAFMSQANTPTLTPDKVEKLMLVGGAIPEMYFDSLKAKIFAQGQQAGVEAPNPYEMEVISLD